MKIWVVSGSDGGSDNFPLAAYCDQQAAERRADKENESQGYYEYTIRPVALYSRRPTRATR